MTDDPRHLLDELEALARERYDFEGDHPSPELIEEHVLGTVPPELAQRVAEHLVDCAECSALAADLRDFPDLELPTGQRSLTAQELAADWVQLQGRIKAQGEIISFPDRVAKPTRPDPRTQQIALWRGLAACLALVVAGGALWLSTRAPGFRSGQETQVVDLSPVVVDGDQVRGGGVRPLTRDHVTLVLNFKELPKPTSRFRVEIYDVDRGATAPPLLDRSGIELSEAGNLQLLFARKDLPPRVARIVVVEEGETGAQPVQYVWDFSRR